MVLHEALKALVTGSDGPCISIYLPTGRSGPDIQKGAIRLRNLISQAEKKIADKRLSDKLLEPAFDILEQGPKFWQNLDNGLALFLAPDFDQLIILPDRVGETVEVGDTFYLRPLLPSIDHGQHFFVLTLEQDHPRLFDAEPNGMKLVRDSAWSERLDEIVRRTELPADVGFHPSGSVPATGQAASAKFHALGESPEDYRQTQLDRMMLGVAKAVDNFLKDRPVPLVLVGNPKLLGLYRKHNRHNHLLEDAVSKNPSDLDDMAIHRHAFEVVSNAFGKPADVALERFIEAPPEQIGKLPEDVVFGALDGRIDSLLVTAGASVWGKISDSPRSLDIGDGRRADDLDLVDVAARETLLNGGDVFVYEPSTMPDDLVLAALFRY